MKTRLYSDSNSIQSIPVIETTSNQLNDLDENYSEEFQSSGSIKELSRVEHNGYSIESKNTHGNSKEGRSKQSSAVKSKLNR